MSDDISDEAPEDLTIGPLHADQVLGIMSDGMPARIAIQAAKIAKLNRELMALHSRLERVAGERDQLERAFRLSLHDAARGYCRLAYIDSLVMHARGPLADGVRDALTCSLVEVTALGDDRPAYLLGKSTARTPDA